MFFNHDIAGQVFEQVFTELVFATLNTGIVLGVNLIALFLRAIARGNVVDQSLHVAGFHALKLLEIDIVVLGVLDVISVNSVLSGYISVFLKLLLNGSDINVGNLS